MLPPHVGEMSILEDESLFEFPEPETYDSQITERLHIDYSFTLLEATYLHTLNQHMSDSDYISFNLAVEDDLILPIESILDYNYFVNKNGEIEERYPYCKHCGSKKVY